MALMEVEMRDDNFNLLLNALCTSGPIPVGVLNALPNRLIADFTWGEVEVGLVPPGFNLPVGTLTARCAVTLRHVSIAELDVDPNATGITTAATAWIHVSVSATRIKVDLLSMEAPGAPLQWFLSPVPVFSQIVPIEDDFSFAAGALLLSNEIVTLRLATRATDSLTATPLNLIVNHSDSDEWGIRISNEFFTEQLLDAINQVRPPAGTTIEDQPGAFWGNFFNDGWKVHGSVGYEKEDACPALIEDVDLSIGVDITLTPSADLTVTPAQLVLRLTTSSDVSDWDTFRCWLGSGGIFSSIIGYVGTAVIGAATGGLGFLASGIISLVKIAEEVRLGAGQALREIEIDDFTLISTTETSATYESRMDLPSLTITRNGVTAGTITNPVLTGPFGMLISGRMPIILVSHNRTFTPNAGALTSSLKNTYDCGRHTWLYDVDIQTIEILDRAIVGGSDLGRVPVTVFYSSIATPNHLWSVEKPAAALTQSVNIKASELVKPGDVGRIYLHTSAGIRRFDISAVPEAAAISQVEHIAAVAQCARASKMFTALDEIQWLIDPPPFQLGFPPLRQWMFTFSELPSGTNIKFYTLQNGVRSEKSIAVMSEKGGQGSIELITDATTEVILEHNQKSIEQGRLKQRWIIPTEMIETTGRAQRLSRKGSVINITQKSGTLSHDLSTGLTRQLADENGHSNLVPRKRKAKKEVHEGKVDEKGSMTQVQEQTILEIEENKPSFSLTLPRGKVAAMFENKLVIGIPWQKNSVIMQPES